MKYKFVNPNKVEISLKEVEDFLKSLNYNIIINDYHDDENPCFENDFFEVTVFGEKNHLRGGKVFECANFGILYKYEDIEVLMPFISCDIDYYLSVREAIREVRKSLKNNAIIEEVEDDIEVDKEPKPCEVVVVDIGEENQDEDGKPRKEFVDFVVDEMIPIVTDEYKITLLNHKASINADSISYYFIVEGWNKELENSKDIILQIRISDHIEEGRRLRSRKRWLRRQLPSYQELPSDITIRDCYVRQIIEDDFEDKENQEEAKIILRNILDELKRNIENGNISNPKQDPLELDE